RAITASKCRLRNVELDAGVREACNSRSEEDREDDRSCAAAQGSDRVPRFLPGPESPVPAPRQRERMDREVRPVDCHRAADPGAAATVVRSRSEYRAGWR